MVDFACRTCAFIALTLVFASAASASPARAMSSADNYRPLAGESGAISALTERDPHTHNATWHICRVLVDGDSAAQKCRTLFAGRAIAALPEWVWIVVAVSTIAALTGATLVLLGLRLAVLVSPDHFSDSLISSARGRNRSSTYLIVFGIILLVFSVAGIILPLKLVPGSAPSSGALSA